MTSSGFSSPRGLVQAPKPLVWLPIPPPDTFSRAVSSFSPSRNAISQNINMRTSIKSPAESSGSQCPVTMQTRVAVRDATPHRFQIVPLREANGLNTIPEPHVFGKKGMKYKSQVLPSVNWRPSPSSFFVSCSRSNVSIVILHRFLEVIVPHPSSLHFLKLKPTTALINCIWLQKKCQFKRRKSLLAMPNIIVQKISTNRNRPCKENHRILRV